MALQGMGIDFENRKIKKIILGGEGGTVIQEDIEGLLERQNRNEFWKMQ